MTLQQMLPLGNSTVERGLRDAGAIGLRRIRIVCSCGECRSCTMRRLWAEGRFDGRKRGHQWDEWSADEYRFLEQHAGTVPLAELAEMIGERFGNPRTPHAVRVKAVRRGISLWVHGMSMAEIETLFHIDHRAIRRWWVDTGLLRATRWSGRGPNEGWWFDPSDVEAFVREHAYAYDWRKMKPGHRLAKVAEVVNRADPWLSYQDLMDYVGLSEFPLDRWRRRGLVPFKRRPKSGGSGQIMVRGRDFTAIKAAIEAARGKARVRSRANSTAARLRKLGLDRTWLRAVLFECAECGRLIERPERPRERGRDVTRRRLLCPRCQEVGRG